MNVIFLDIDGVLNYRGCKSRCHGTFGVENKQMQRLQQIVQKTGAKIVLCSSWKNGWHKDNKELQDEWGNYLDERFKEFGLEIFDKTKDRSFDRGEGIDTYVKKNGITNWVVLDDDVFEDYKRYKIMSHLVKTSFYKGGLIDKHISLAIKKLNNKK